MLARYLTRALLLASGSLVVIAGAAALFIAFERLRSPAPSGTLSDLSNPEPQHRRSDYFSVRRTRSELGYTYWILEGHGHFQCFELFDTWKEAIAEATFRSEYQAFV